MPPIIRCRKKRGEWAELVFMARAAAHGLTVSKPFGESARYDFVVEGRRGRLHRVQVKSTTNKYKYGNSYIVALRTDNQARRRRYGVPSRRYTRKQIDFIAAYIVPEDVWYILPIRLIERLVGNIWLTPGKTPHRHQRYREAWHFLKC